MVCKNFVYKNLVQPRVFRQTFNFFEGFSRLAQDNAPSHKSAKSAFTTRRLEQWGVKTIIWPAESPDLNPIELVWGSMKADIRCVK